jgi:hypothetical protein
MAKRRRKSHRAVTHRRRRRHAMATARRNPVRRRRQAMRHIRRRRRVHRNPPILSLVKETVMDTAMVLGGGAVVRAAGKVLPTFANPYAEAAKGVAVAIGVRMLGARFLGRERARFLGAGAMQVPVKNLIVAQLPAAAGFLGDYEVTGSPMMGDPYADGGYLADGQAYGMDVMADYSEPVSSPVGSYGE